jgi:alkyl hydroperoxide reductase subunit AhpF
VPLSDTIELQTYNFAIDRDAVSQYGILRIPAIALVRLESDGNGTDQLKERDYGIRFYGVPSGYEFMSLIGGILDVSRGESGLSAQSKAALARVVEPVHLQIFSTPT